MAKGDMLVWGHHAVLSVLEHHPQAVLELWLDESYRQNLPQEIDEACKTFGITPHYTPAKTLEKLTKGNVHQGIVARRRAVARYELDDVVAELHAKNKVPLFLALDQVQDPQNLGACLRVADAAGVDGVIMVRDRSAPINGTVAKAASGALESVRLINCSNLARTLEQLKRHGIWVIGTADTETGSYTAADFTLPCCVVLGSEGRGLRELTRQSCDISIRIPMFGSVSSLNVSAACAVCLFEARRQREQK